MYEPKLSKLRGSLANVEQVRRATKYNSRAAICARRVTCSTRAVAVLSCAVTVVTRLQRCSQVIELGYVTTAANGYYATDGRPIIRIASASRICDLQRENE